MFFVWNSGEGRKGEREGLQLVAGKETLWVEERMEMSLGVVTIHNVSVGVTQTIWMASWKPSSTHFPVFKEGLYSYVHINEHFVWIGFT